MKIIIFIVALTSVLFATDVKIDNVKSYLTEKNKKINKVVAKVDGTIIRQRHVDSQVAAKLQQTFFHKTISKEKKLEYNKDALQDLINNELIYSYAKRKKILVTVDKLEEVKQSIVKKFKDEKTLNELLKAENTSMKEVERNIDVAETIKAVYSKEIETNFNDEELEKYYENNKYKFLRPESKNIQLITIHVNPDEKDGFKNAQKRAKEAYEKITDGEIFDDVASDYSNDMYRIKGGNLGFIHKGTFEDIDKITEKMKKGDLSPIIENETKILIVKVIDVNPEEQIPLEKVKAGLKKDLKKNREKEKLTKILDEQKKISKIEIF